MIRVSLAVIRDRAALLGNDSGRCIKRQLSAEWGLDNANVLGGNVLPHPAEEDDEE
jgi:hypothetical protein